eukprot:EG_transcript_7869
MPRLQDMFRRNQPTEQPTYTYPSGDRYTGQWLNGRKHGYGVAEFVSGNRYEGEWDNDFKHGKGTITFVDGTTYVGDWSKDHKHGYGEARFASGNRYEGQWVDDAMEGKGTFYYARGDIYSGEWKRGKISGYGTWISYDKSCRYEGEWLDGLRHGRGTLLEGGVESEVEYRMGHRVDNRHLEEQKAAKENAQHKQGEEQRPVQPQPPSSAGSRPQSTPRSPAISVGENEGISGIVNGSEEPTRKGRKKKKKEKNRTDLDPGASTEVPRQKRKKKRDVEDFNEEDQEVDLPDGDSPPFLPAIPKGGGNSSVNRTPVSQTASYQPSAPSSSVPPVPRTRLPPLAGAPKVPPVDRDASYRRKQSGSRKDGSAAGRKSANSSLTMEQSVNSG